MDGADHDFRRGQHRPFVVVDSDNTHIFNP